MVRHPHKQEVSKCRVECTNGSVASIPYCLGRDVVDKKTEEAVEKEGDLNTQSDPEPTQALVSNGSFGQYTKKITKDSCLLAAG